MTLLTEAASPPEAGANVIYLTWEQYLAWLAGKLKQARNAAGVMVKLPPAWVPGDHGAFIAPTGEGKTTHAVGVLGLRKWVLALDAKGEDETLTASGYIRVRELPADGWRAAVNRLRDKGDQRAWKEIYERIDAGQPARVIVGGAAHNDREDDKLRKLMREAITFCRHSEGWTLYVDEFELLSSQRMFHLGPPVERMLITARRAKTSVITSYQAQAWVSSHAHRQAKQVTMWQTGSRQMIKNIAEGMGRDWRQLAEVIDLLPKWHSVTIPRGTHDPMVITRAPKLPDKRQKPVSSRDAGR